MKGEVSILTGKNFTVGGFRLLCYPVYNIHCTLYNIHSKLYIVHYTVHIVHYTSNTTLYAVHCTLYNIHCTQYIEEMQRRERFILLHMWKILHGQTSNDLNVQLASQKRLGTLAIIPSKSKSRTSSAANQTLFDNSFAVQGPKYWNAMLHNLNSIQSLEHFKDQLTKFLLSFPDMPPIRGCSPLNSNSLLSWRIERGYTSLWGGRN